MQVSSSSKKVNGGASRDLIRAELRKTARELPNWSSPQSRAAKMRASRQLRIPASNSKVVARHYWEANNHEEALRLGLKGLARLHGGGLMGHATSFARTTFEMG